MTLVRADALRLPLRDETVDLIVTSPPYFALRSYRDGGHHYDGQIGSEPTPQAFLQALWRVTAECWRVLKPSGSMFVNLGDKRSGVVPGTTSFSTGRRVTGRSKPRAAREQAAFGRPKSKMLLPHRYAIGCEDGLADPDGKGWIVRQDIVWDKPNGLPESVRDRTRDSHEYWFHLTKQERYFSAVDLLRAPSSGYHREPCNIPEIPGQRKRAMLHTTNPLGALPGSVWRIPSEPLTVPEHLGVDHFAAFPSELPRRLILGWSPSGVCTACGEGRRPTLDRSPMVVKASSRRLEAQSNGNASRTSTSGTMTQAASATVTGEACGCPTPDAPTRPSVVLDPFGGTGTTAMVARALGRYAVNIDLSADYLKLARWRIYSSGGASKARTRTNLEKQGVML